MELTGVIRSRRAMRDFANAPIARSTAILRGRILASILFAGLISFLFVITHVRPANARPLQELASGRMKIAEGEYAIYERDISGALGPLAEEVYNFHESWTLWRVEKGQ